MRFAASAKFTAWHINCGNPTHLSHTIFLLEYVEMSPLDLLAVLLPGTLPCALAKNAAMFSGHIGATSMGQDSIPTILFRLTGSLLVIIGLIYGTVYLLKILITKRRDLGKGTGMIAVLEHAHLGPNREICLVRVLDRILVMAISGNEIRLLSEVGCADTPSPEGLETQFDAPAQGSRNESTSQSGSPAEAEVK